MMETCFTFLFSSLPPLTSNYWRHLDLPSPVPPGNHYQEITMLFRLRLQIRVDMYKSAHLLVQRKQ